MIMTFLSANGVYGAGEKPDVWGVKKSLFSFSFMEKRLGGNGIGFEASSSGSNRLDFGLYFPVRDCSPTSYVYNSGDDAKFYRLYRRIRKGETACNSFTCENGLLPEATKCSQKKGTSHFALEVNLRKGPDFFLDRQGRSH